VLVQKIVIQGKEYNLDLFKPHDIDECEFPSLLRVIEEVGEFAADGYEDMASIVRGSPLLHIEGLIRYQLIKHDSDSHGLSIKCLETTSDFFHERHFVEHNINCSKIVFLFNFLHDIVFLSDSPQYITKEELDKIKNNLRTLIMLCDSQLTAQKSHKNKTKNDFKMFAYYVWTRNNCENIKPAKFWNKAISILIEHSGELELGYKDKTRGTLVFCLEPYEENVKTDENSYTIKVFDGKTGTYSGEKVGHRKAKDGWKKLQEEFLLHENNKKK